MNYVAFQAFRTARTSDAGPPEFDFELAERLRVHFIQPPPRPEEGLLDAPL